MSPIKNRHWLLLSLGAAVGFAILISLFQGHHSYFFEVTLHSSRAETARFSYDTVKGARASTVYRHTPGSPIYRFPIPTGTSTWMRFAPLTDEGTATFSNAQIVDRNGTLVYRFSPADFQPRSEIEACTIQNDEVTIRTTPHATIPEFEITLPGVVNLRKLNFDPVYTTVCVLPPFLIVFLGSLAAKFSFGLIPRRPKVATAGDPPQPATSPALQLLAKAREFLQRISQIPAFLRSAFILLTAGLILFVRLPDRFLNAQFWAEDAYFFTQALKAGADSLFMPYGGYLLLAPRIAELMATWIPLELVPLFLNLCALAIAFIVISRVLSGRTPLSYKPLLALAIVFIPRPEDILLSIENVQWILALGYVLILVSDDAQTTGQYIYDFLAVVVCGLTGVFSILLLPLFAFRAWQRKTLHSTALLAVVAITAIIQVYFVSKAPQLYANQAPASIDYGYVPSIVGYQMLARLFGGEWIPHLSQPALRIFGGVVISYYLFLFLVRGSTFVDRLRRNYLLIVLGIFLTASIYRFKNVLFIFASPEHIARYFFVPQIIFIWLLVEETREGLWRRIVGYILLFAFIVTSWTIFRVEPLWDFRWRQCAEKIRQGENVVVPVNPPGWYFQYPGKPR